MSAKEAGIPGTINALASGAWRVMEGQPVEVFGRKNLGHAAEIRVGKKAPIHAGRLCWVPTSWVTFDPPATEEPAAEPAAAQPEPPTIEIAACPACGAQLDLGVV